MRLCSEGASVNEMDDRSLQRRLSLTDVTSHVQRIFEKSAKIGKYKSGHKATDKKGDKAPGPAQLQKGASVKERVSISPQINCFKLRL
ncbi:unnamed protein product [Gongylonema pulchrum]|uniref:H15 domain-containing protein n=1 Tax=Gongylonema pulchrum TaxID=637853 RepID=A0A183ENL7_9BILA|nr:unnamed protein product [Gongylonema pulchrum]